MLKFLSVANESLHHVAVTGANTPQGAGNPARYLYQ
jgi:hypothetical protein